MTNYDRCRTIRRIYSMLVASGRYDNLAATEKIARDLEISPAAVKLAIRIVS